MWWEWDLQLSVKPTNSSVISYSEPLRELFGWIWLGVAVIGPQEIKGLLTNIFQNSKCYNPSQMRMYIVTEQSKLKLAAMFYIITSARAHFWILIFDMVNSY